MIRGKWKCSTILNRASSNAASSASFAILTVGFRVWGTTIRRRWIVNLLRSGSWSRKSDESSMKSSSRDCAQIPRLSTRRMGRSTARCSSLTQIERSGNPKQAVQATFEGRWLLRNFAYHDIMMSVSMDCRPLIRGFYWSSEDDTLADPYFGFASRILYLISETSILNADFAEAEL